MIILSKKTAEIVNGITIRYSATFVVNVAYPVSIIVNGHEELKNIFLTNTLRIELFVFLHTSQKLLD